MPARFSYPCADRAYSKGKKGTRKGGGGEKGRKEINRRKTAKLEDATRVFEREPNIGCCLSASGTEIRWKSKRKRDGRCARTRMGIGVATSCEMFMKARLIYLHSRSADFIALVAWTPGREKARQSIGRDSVIHLSNYFFFRVFIFNEYFSNSNRNCGILLFPRFQIIFYTFRLFSCFI